MGEHPYRRAKRRRHLQPEAVRKAMQDWRKRQARDFGGRSKVPHGVVIWSGPTRHPDHRAADPREVAVVVSSMGQPSSNPKVGDMLQVYVVPLGMSPMDAVREGKDSAICGACPQRPAAGGACYVNAAWGPRWVRDAIDRGSYLDLRQKPGEVAKLVAGAAIRITAHGDPAAAPVELWNLLVEASSSHTAYTHAWASLEPSEWADWCMASVDLEAELQAANAAGWRTFRVVGEGYEPTATETLCSAQRANLSCLACRACGGRNATNRDIYIGAHGFRGRRLRRK